MAKRPPLTHFLCVPLLSSAARPQFEAACAIFREKLQTQSIPLSPDALGRAIRPTGTMHLTLGVMSLNNEDRVQGAVKFLEDVDLPGLLADGQARDESTKHTKATEAIRTNSGNSEGTTSADVPIGNSIANPSGLRPPFTIDITSLKGMRNANRTSILYAEPTDATNLFLPFCEQLRAKFTEAGYINEENRPLKLHATVLNTIYASSKGRKGPRNKRPMQVDATELIQQCEDLVWAKDVVLEKIAICEMGAEKVLDGEGKVVDERYKEIASRPLLI